MTQGITPPRPPASGDDKRRPHLGRGLMALLGEDDNKNAPSDRSIAARALPVEQLKPGKFQPRHRFDDEQFKSLVESVKEKGILQPILVRRDPETPHLYEIVAGERRWRAAQLAGLQTIPAVVRDIPDEAAVAVALIENIQREDLNPIEEARSLHRLCEEFGLTHADAAEAVGRSRATVTNLLRLLELPRPVRELLEHRQLDMGHARALLGVESPELQTELAQRVVKQGLSVRETESAVRKLTGGVGAGKGGKPAAGRASGDPNVRRLEADLAETLGATVTIEHGPKGGRVVIRYNGLDELEGILSHIK
jgi:ParB family chromosome partitioning protein